MLLSPQGFCDTVQHYKLGFRPPTHKGHPVQAFGHGGHTICWVDGSHSSRSGQLDAAHSPQI